MAVDRGYAFKDGTKVTFRPLPPLVLAHLMTTRAGEPQPPSVWVKRGKNKVKELNVNAPEFVAAYKAWEQGRQLRLMRYIVGNGVVENPSDEEANELSQYLAPEGQDDVKYLWVVSKLDNEAEIGDFTDAVMGQTLVTLEGIAESEAEFPGDGEPPADSELPLQE